MKQVLTIVCKLNPSKEVVKMIDTTLEMFAAACNYANQDVKPSITSKTTIQSLVYQTIRKKYGLSANLAVRACARVGANRKLQNRKTNQSKHSSRLRLIMMLEFLLFAKKTGLLV